MMFDSTSSWFLAQLKPNSALIARRNLERQGFSTFLPTTEETSVKDKCFVTKTRPLFPGYIFVALDITRGQWRKVNSTNGITRLVGFGEAPSAVPDGLIAQLKMRCDPDQTLMPAGTFALGDQVRVTIGPFANFVAEIEKIGPDKRVWVLMEIMGGQTRVAINARIITSA